MTDVDPSRLLAETHVADASKRLQFQHDYSIEGFKTLTLINGGAIIALLTYAGHSAGSTVAKRLSEAFLAYAVGLILSVLAYLFAYLSQAELMNGDMTEAYRLLGIEADGTRREEFERKGMRRVHAGIGLSVLSLFAFVAGSWLAMRALS